MSIRHACKAQQQKNTKRDMDRVRRYIIKMEDAREMLLPCYRWGGEQVLGNTRQ